MNYEEWLAVQRYAAMRSRRQPVRWWALLAVMIGLTVVAVAGGFVP